jgi:predicted amidophosphoribosyltransferase
MAAYFDSTPFKREDLIPVLPTQDGVCDVCHQGAAGTRCPSCAKAVSYMVMSKPPVLLPIAIRVTGTPLGRATYVYKDGDNPGYRDREARKLAWLVWHFMTRHEVCLARAIGAERFDYIVPMPSSGKREGTHPLVDLLRQIPWSADRLVEDLYFTGSDGPAHEIDEQRYDFRGDRLRERNVLLFDDTFTSGANVFSALDALAPTRAKVAVAIIGRHFDPEWSAATRQYHAHVSSLPFTFKVCALCDQRREARLPTGAVATSPRAGDPRDNTTRS